MRDSFYLLTSSLSSFAISTGHAAQSRLKNDVRRIAGSFLGGSLDHNKVVMSSQSVYVYRAVVCVCARKSRRKRWESVTSSSRQGSSNSNIPRIPIIESSKWMAMELFPSWAQCSQLQANWVFDCWDILNEIEEVGEWKGDELEAKIDDRLGSWHVTWEALISMDQRAIQISRHTPTTLFRSLCWEQR